MRFILLGTEEDSNYLPVLRQQTVGHTISPILVTPSTIAEVQMAAEKYSVDAVLVTNQQVLKMLAPPKSKELSLDKYQGSIFKRKAIHGLTKSDLEFLILSPLQQLVTVPYGKFLFQRFFKKFTERSSWWKQTAFKWEVATDDTVADLYQLFASADYVAVDVETRQHDLGISCSGYCGIWFTSESITTRSIVLPITSVAAVAWMRKFNSLAAPKIFQNGSYDNAYFLRYNAPIECYAFDTLSLFHSWYSELPRDLGFISSFTLRDYEFWKDDSQTADLYEYYRYNARDTWGTANAFLALLSEMPEWAIKNYTLQFPITWPAIACAAEGWKADEELLEKVRKEQEEKLEKELAAIQNMVSRGFNPSSSAQCLRLLHALGNKDLINADEKAIKKAMLRHPIVGRIFVRVLAYRKARKLISTYLVSDKLFHGRFLYSLNTAATDTARLASREHAFWTGIQIQNIPRGKTVKQIYVSDDGWLLGEADYEQAEARDTGYLSGDTALIRAVEDSSKDFHGTNASLFFGIPYEKIICSTWSEVLNAWEHKRLDVPLIDIAKRTNHGANYNMAEGMLLETMGLEKVWQAQALLGLPGFWSPVDVTRYLLQQFEKAYPTVKKDWYDYVKFQVLSTNKLVSAFGWTRYCFANPKTSKPALNAYVAHPPQNLNAGTLNRAFMRVFREIQIPNWDSFRIKAQIHDSIPFQYRPGNEHLAHKVKEIMEEKFTVIDCKGIKRTVMIPAKLKLGVKRWSEL